MFVNSVGAEIAHGRATAPSGLSTGNRASTVAQDVDAVQTLQTPWVQKFKPLQRWKVFDVSFTDDALAVAREFRGIELQTELIVGSEGRSH